MHLLRGCVVLIITIQWTHLLGADKVYQGNIEADSVKKVKQTVRISNQGKEFEPFADNDQKFHWESYIRLRHELWDNQEDLNSNFDDLYSFLRVKLYLGAGYKPAKNLKIYARIVNESRFYGHKVDGDSLNNDHFWRPEKHYFELVLPQLYVLWENVGGSELDIKIGRQYLRNVGFGDQWLIGDGTPIDGSKTFYFNV